MKRTIIQQLINWKNKPNRKPLILNGARQVGKTYILKEFGFSQYEKMAFFSLDRDARAREVFENNSDTSTMLLLLSALSGVDITAGDTLVVLDEIQDCPAALTALKFLCEDAPGVHVAVAGSLLGISVHEGVSFPVGKVDMIKMYPMNFCEFLMALGKDRLAGLLAEGCHDAISVISGEFISLLRQYYFVGGMPAAVQSYVNGEGLNAVRNVQQQILFDYTRDFSKHAPAKDVPRVNMVWNGIPSQLAKENKKFIYGALKKGARATEFEIAIQWLVDAGMVYKVPRLSKVDMPLKFYEEISAFKLFMLDVGLMGAMVGAPASEIIANSNIFKEYKGAFTELYVHNELIQKGLNLFYYSTDNSLIEIDFVTQLGYKIVPIEVKAETNVKAKSLKMFVDQHPSLKGVRISMLAYADQQWMQNLPLYDFVSFFN